MVRAVTCPIIFSDAAQLETLLGRWEPAFSSLAAVIAGELCWAPAGDTFFVVILRSALFAGGRTYRLAGSVGVAAGMHRSFVGSPPLREGLHFLRMTICGRF
jgi:hypothetical protein